MHLRGILKIQRVIDSITYRSAILQHSFSFSINFPRASTNIHCRTDSQDHFVIDSTSLSVGPVFETLLFPPAVSFAAVNI
jgi:hypothetical protein